MTTALDPVFAMVAGQATDGFLIVATRSPGGGPPDAHAFAVHEIEVAQQYAASMARSRQVYLESALQLIRPAAGKRGTVANAAQFSLVSLDFDGAWGLHKKTDLPEAPEDLQRLLDAAGAPLPTLVLHTGGGLLALWAIDTPITLLGSEHQRAKLLGKAFQLRLKETALQRFGWNLDGTSDLCRLIRVPGTLNHKFDPPRPVHIWEESSSRATVKLACLESFAKPPAVSKTVQTQNVTDDDQLGRLGSWTSVLAGCAFARSCVENAEALPEPEWYALAGLLSRCEDGTARFHEISALDPRYDCAEAEIKFAQARTASPPRTCRSIHEDLGFEGCRRCVFWGHA